MVKSGNKNSAKGKKDKIQVKSGPAAIVKAKDKRKKLVAAKKIKEKLGEEIQSANAEFSDLQTTLITEKENKKIENEKTEERKPLKATVQPDTRGSQAKQVEQTTTILANL